MGIKRRKIQVITSRLKAFNFFSDAFTSSLNAAWKYIRGTWTSSSSKASTSNLPTDYPLATVKMAKTNVTAQIESVDQGAGIALWVTDSGNWWGVVSGSDGATDCNCSTCYGSNCNAYASACGSYYCQSSYYVCNQYVNATCAAGFYDPCPSTYCSSYYCSSYNAYNAKNKTGGTCKGYSCGSYACNAASFTCFQYNAAYCASSTSTCNAYACASYYDYCASSYNYSYNCSCSTCYPPFLRLLRSVSSTVSELYKWSLSATANSMKVITSGTDITAKAYSDNSLTTQIGSDLTYSATGATIDTSFGIVVAPSSYSQGNSLDNFSATVN